MLLGKSLTTKKVYSIRDSKHNIFLNHDYSPQITTTTSNLKKKPFNINNRLIEITKSNKSFEKIIIVIIISMQN
jgi:hypothetical protein